MALQHRIFKTGGYSLDHFYLCNYKPKSAGIHDRLSSSLLRFKNGLDPDVRAWIECSVSELAKKFTGSGASIVSALGHGETVASDSTPLSNLCQRLQQLIGLNDARMALRKSKPTEKLSLLSKDERMRAIIGNYFVDAQQIPTDRILVVDDILTTGTTVGAIVEVLKNITPKFSIKVFTFALCDYLSDLTRSISLQGYNVNWIAARGWQTGDIEEHYGENYERLCERILNDDF